MSMDFSEWSDIMPRLSPGGLAIDAGANGGGWTKPMAGFFDVVHAFEPVPANYIRLEQHVADEISNGRVIAYNFGLMDSDGSHGFDINYVGYAQRDPHRSAAADTPWPSFFPCRKIDSLGLSGVKFLKIDVDGSEPKLLEGAVETISRDRPLIFIEVKWMSPDTKQSFLDRLGYRMEKHYRVDDLWVPNG